MRRLLLLLIVVGMSFGQQKMLPRVNLKDLKHKTVSTEKMLDGKLTLVNFWATYCVPCRKEMKHLDRMNKQYHDQNVQVVGVSIDDSRTMGRVKSMIRSQKLTYRILLDTEQKLYQNFNTSAMPFSILVSPDGRILWEHTGYLPGDEKEMETQINQALSKQQSSGK